MGTGLNDGDKLSTRYPLPYSSAVVLNLKILKKYPRFLWRVGVRIVQTQANVYLDYIPRYIDINSTTTRLIDSRRAPFVTSGMAAFHAYFRISWAPELAWLWQATLELGKEECVKRKILVKDSAILTHCFRNQSH